MTKLVLLRHGESIWNKENRFTGWTDVDLSERGIKEAKMAGQVLKEKGFVFDLAYTSLHYLGDQEEIAKAREKVINQYKKTNYNNMLKYYYSCFT